MESATVATPDHGPRRLNLFVCLAVIAATFAIYLQSAGFGFVHFDDSGDALNLHVRGGLSFQSLRWALLSGSDSNWLPLTRLSHIVDYSLFAGAAGPRHIENLLLHTLASLMVFFFLLRATGDRRPAAFSGLLFAVHPLHVESVAWIAERKDVLSALFWFLTLWAWVGYTARPSRRRYLVTLLFFGLGLMAKPMTVTLPAVMFLLDIWPLRRPFSKNTLIEKIPFAVMAAGVSAAAVVAQRAGGAVKSLAAIGAGLRVENALVTWVWYVVKTVWPSNLAVWYPYPAMVPAWAAAGCAAILAGVSFLAVRLRGRFPYLAVGWFWYLVTTLPVIGLIQVGLQARADRYMYIPMVGLGIAAAWGAVEAMGTSLAVVAICALLGFSACAWRQTTYWRSGETLFRRAIAVTEGNYLAWQNLGFELSQDPGRKTEAIACLRTSAQIKPDSAGAHSSLCALLPDKTEALRECDTALQIEPDNWQARNNRAAALKAMGRIPEAMTEYRLAIRERPSAAEAHANLGMLLFDSGQMREALAEEDKALALDPEMGSAHFIRGRVLLETGKTESAIEEFEAVLQIEPNSAEVHGMLAAALSRVPWGVFDCLKEFGTAVSLNPNDASTRAGFAGALSGAGRNEEALEQIKAAVRLEPGPKWADRLLQFEAKSARPR